MNTFQSTDFQLIDLQRFLNLRSGNRRLLKTHAIVSLLSEFKVERYISYVRRLRPEHAVYTLSLFISRALNALTALALIKIFAPTAVGELNYYQASSAAIGSILSFSIDISMNSLLSSRRAAGTPVKSVVVAGALVVCTASLLSATFSLIILNAWLGRVTANDAMLLSLSVVASLTFGFLSGICFSLKRLSYVSSSWVFGSIFYVCVVALLAGGRPGGQHLFALYILGQFSSVLFICGMLFIFRPFSSFEAAKARTSDTVREVWVHVRRIVFFGFKQSFASFVMLTANWLLQFTIVNGRGGAAANAVFGLGNQVYNLVVFAPSIFSPLLISAIAARSKDAAAAADYARMASMAMCGLAIIIWISVGGLFGLIIPYLPAQYSGAEPVVIISAAAAVFQLIKSPTSSYFQVYGRAAPDVGGAMIGAGAILVMFFLGAGTPLAASASRLLAQISTTMFVVGLFAYRNR